MQQNDNKYLSCYTVENAIIWLALAFQAGAINTGGLLSVHRFVTHVTGFASHFGIEFVDKNLVQSLGMLSAPIFFLMGSMVSAYLVDRKILHNKTPHYAIAYFIMSMLLFIDAIGGINNAFGKFGEPIDIYHDYFLLASLCLASGMQNATVTSAFGAVVRTSHLTGITTDLGIGIMRILTKTEHGKDLSNEVRANWMRIGIITFFVAGSTLSTYAYHKWEYGGFLIPAIIAFCLFLWALLRFKIHKQYDFSKKIAS